MTDNVYFKEWELNGQRWRLEIQPPGPPITTEIFVEIPEEAIFDFGDVDTGFERRLFGLQRTSVLRVQIDALELDTPTFRPLLDAIRQPIQINVGTLPHDDIGSVTRQINAGTLWTLCCDFGLGYAFGSDDLRDSIVIQAVQRPLPRQRYKVKRAGSSAARPIIELTLVDVARSAMETVLAEDVAAYILNTETPSGPYNVAFDVIYRDASTDLIHVRAEGQQSGPVHVWKRYYLLWELYEAIEILSAAAYKVIRRNSAAQFYADSEAGFGHLFDHWRFYKHDYLRFGGVQPNPFDHQTNAIRYCGTEHLATSAGDVSAPIGGILIDQYEDNQHSLYKFDSMYDFMKVTSKAVGSAVGIRQVNRTQLILEYRRLTTGAASGLVPLEFDGESDIDFEDGGEIVARGKVTTPGLEGDDLAEYTSDVYWGNNVEDEEDEDVRGLWHNLPRVGDSKNVYPTYDMGVNTQKRVIDAINGLYYGVISEGSIPWKLYYIDNPSVEDGGEVLLLDSPHPIRLHEACSMQWGPGATEITYSGTTAGYPVITSLAGNNNNAEAFIALWWELLWAEFVRLHRDACIPSTLGQTLAFVFGNRAQVSFPSLSSSLSLYVNPNQIGSPLKLTASGTANEFLPPGRDFFGHISTEVNLVSLKISLKTGEAEANYLHIEKP